MLLPIFVTSDALDRRRRPRLRLAYPLLISRPGEVFRTETKTEDISCEGFFCVTDRVYAPRETLECELVIPSQEPRQAVEHNMILRCRAEVVRVVRQANTMVFGVACRLADYTVGEIIEQDVAMGCSSSDSLSVTTGDR